MRRFLNRLTLFAAAVVALSACQASSGSTAQPTVTVTVTTSGSESKEPTDKPTDKPTEQHPTPKPTSKPTSFGKRPVVAPDGRVCPDHPTAACTGVPPEVKLKDAPLNDSGEAHRVDIAGRRLNNLHIKGDLIILADNVVITNSVIDGRILNERDGEFKSFTIVDSTVGPEEGCDSLPAIGEGEFTAVRVHVRNHGDGIRDAGDNIVVMDSYIDLCSNAGDHSDGIQGYTAGRNLVFDHNTIDQRDVPDHNAPIFFPTKQSPRVANVTITNNLLMGGTFSIQLWDIAGQTIVRNNMLLDNSWDYKPVEAECDRIEWKDNKLVEIDEDYRITDVVGPLDCMG